MNNSQPNDKNLMENLLLWQKGVCDLYMHGAIESSTANVHGAFRSAMDDALTMQNEIYDKMTAKGWYKTETVEQTKINSAKAHFFSSAN